MDEGLTLVIKASGAHLKLLRDLVGAEVFAEVMEGFSQEVERSLDRLERAVIGDGADRARAAHRLAGTLDQFGLSWAAQTVGEFADPHARPADLLRSLPRMHACVRAALRLTRRIRAEAPIQTADAQNEYNVTL